MWHMGTPIKRLNTYRIFNWLSGMLAGLSDLTIKSAAIQPLNWVRSNLNQSRWSGSGSPPSSGACGTAEAALATNLRALANCVLKRQTSSQDCCVSWVISPSSPHSSSSVPSTAGFLQASSSSFDRGHIVFLIQYDCTQVAGLLVSVWSWSPLVMLLSVVGGRTPSVLYLQIWYSGLPSSAPPVLLPTSSASLWSPHQTQSCWWFISQWPGCLRTPGLSHHGVPILA